MSETDKPSWRDLMPVHPAADMFPMLDDAELVALGNDIKKNGLAHPIAFIKDDDGKAILIDGRNRLAALERVGVRLQLQEPTPRPWRRGGAVYREYDLVTDPEINCPYPHFLLSHSIVDDPIAHIVSINIHRRHLTQETKRAIIAQLLMETPERSDRATAALVKVDHKTVAAVRRDQEQLGSIPQLEKRTGKDGKARPAKNRGAAGEKVSAAGVQKKPVKPAPARGKDVTRTGVLEAVSTLAGLPTPREVAGYFEGQDVAILVRERLPTAAAWLSNFASIMECAAASNGLPLNQQVNRLVRKLSDFVDDYCSEVSTFLEAHPNLEAEGRECIARFLLSCGNELMGFEQKLDGRKVDADA